MNESTNNGESDGSVGAALARTAYGAFVTAAREITNQGSFHYSDTAIGFAEMNDFFEADQ